MDGRDQQMTELNLVHTLVTPIVGLNQPKFAINLRDLSPPLLLQLRLLMLGFTRYILLKLVLQSNQCRQQVIFIG